MLHYDNDSRRQLAHEHARTLAHEMRRARRLTPDEAGYPGWARLAAEVLGRAQRLLHRKGQRTPAFDS